MTKEIAARSVFCPALVFLMARLFRRSTAHRPVRGVAPKTRSPFLHCWSLVSRWRGGMQLVGSWPCALFVGGVVGMLSSFVLGLVVVLLTRRIPLLLVGRAQRRAAGRADHALLPFLEALERALRSGDSPARAIETAARAHPEILGGQSAPLGASSDQWLDHLRQYPLSPSVAGAVGALGIGSALGALHAPFVDAVATSCRERAALRSDIVALSDQAKYSAILLSGAPVVLSVLLLAGNQTARNVIVQTSAGGILIIVGGLLDGAGFAWMSRLRRKLEVEV